MTTWRDVAIYSSLSLLIYNNKKNNELDIVKKAMWLRSDNNLGDSYIDLSEEYSSKMENLKKANNDCYGRK